MLQTLLMLLALTGLGVIPCQAQTYMPDANLRVWVEGQFPGSITGIMVDENHPGVASATAVDISYLGIVNLGGMSAFSNLEMLLANNNPIDPNTLDLPNSLLTMTLSSCGLTGQLDLCFAVNTQLQTLTVSHNQLTSIAWCGELPSFGINASHNLLTGWSGEPPPNMNYINLAHNMLTNPPDGLVADHVDVSHNLLTELPNMYWGISQTVIASHNQITTFTGSSCTFNNGFVDLSHNQIDLVDLEPQNCNGMWSMDLSHNPLTGGITNLPVALQSLYITDTQLECLPLLPLTLGTLLSTNNSFTCLPNIPTGLDLTPANFGFPPLVCEYPTSCSLPDPSLKVRACLQGAWVHADGLMHDALRQQGLIPLTEPYTAAGYTYVNNITPLTISEPLLNITGPQAIVDWVIVEIRLGPNMPGPLHQSVPALVRRDGSVIATTGDTLIYLQVPLGQYRVAVKHRNHLGGITFAGQHFGYGTTVVDLKNGTQVNPYAFSFAPDGTRLLTMGDVNADKMVKYTGAVNDRDPILQAIGGVIPTNTLSGFYHWADVNMDGTVKYIGANNDRDLVLQVVGGATPTNTRSQVPVY